MTWQEDEHRALWDFLKLYRFTSIYSAVMVTILLIVFIASEVA